MIRSKVILPIVLALLGSWPATTWAKTDSASWAAELSALQHQVKTLNLQVQRLLARQPQRKKNQQKIADFSGYRGEKVLQAAAITTSPTMGMKPSFDGSDLLIAMSSMNQDLGLLQRRQQFFQQRQQFLAPMSRPQIELSGDLIMGVNVTRNAGQQVQQELELSGLEVDLLSEINQKMFSYAALSYDAKDNEQVKISRAFMTFGDLLHSPFYFTGGKAYLPFGRFSSATITSPMTKSMGRIKEKTAILGWFKDNKSNSLLLQSYFGKGATSTAANSNRLNFWGLNGVWRGKVSDQVSLETGVSYTSNILNNASFTTWVSNANGTATGLAKLYPGVDVYARVTSSPVQFNVEYVGLTDRIGTSPVAGNNDLLQQRPRALYAELRYNSQRSYPGMLAVGYGRSWDASALGLPKRSVFLTDNMNLWRSTLQSLEFRFDRNTPPGGMPQSDRQCRFRFWVFF